VSESWDDQIARVRLLSQDAILGVSLLEKEAITAVLARLATAEAMAARAIEALNAVKVRIAFVGHPGEAFWELDGIRMSDWREESQLIEAATNTPPDEWVDKIKREAAATELDALADGCEKVNPVLAHQLRARAAALRAGATGGDLRDKSPDWWLIYFADKEVSPEIFTDEASARARFEMLQQNWTVTLFRAAGATGEKA
jgi:hypothetical protein